MEKDILNDKKSGWLNIDNNIKENVFNFCDEYIDFLNNCKTERETTKYIVSKLENNGFKNIDNIKNINENKVYMINHDKSVYAAIIGSDNIKNGVNIIGAHIDSPRLDLKPNPLYEDAKLALFKTHYYGGIKKYQWVTIPLAIHGTVVKKDGTAKQIVIGEKDDDPVLVISDLLIHLSQEQIEKKASVVIEGEGLDVLVGTKPLCAGEEEKELVKNSILHFLKENYDMDEEDFLSAELEVVPAGKSRECGLDRSMIMGYGQDDRVCAFTSLFAMLEAQDLERTACCILVDKEEIGSVGATGMHSRFFEDVVAEIMALTEDGDTLKVRRTLRNSYMLSSDVSAAYDPLYASAFEKKNTAYFGRGLVLNKYTGSRGKVNTSDANAEYIAKVRNVFDNNGIGFQTAEMGRVDLGGGGTIAYIMANYGMNVIDSGVAVLSMHAPNEVTSKSDIYEVYRGYKAFLKDMR